MLSLQFILTQNVWLQKTGTAFTQTGSTMPSIISGTVRSIYQLHHCKLYSITSIIHLFIQFQCQSWCLSYSESYRTIYDMLVPYNSREWFRVENPVHFPIAVVLRSNENTFAFNYTPSRCNSMWGSKHVLYIFIYTVMYFLWATFVDILLHAETDPAKSYVQIRILWNRSTADALAP